MDGAGMHAGAVGEDAPGREIGADRGERGADPVARSS